jgi:hypothetical protein
MQKTSIVKYSDVLELIFQSSFQYLLNVLLPCVEEKKKNQMKQTKEHTRVSSCSLLKF